MMGIPQPCSYVAIGGLGGSGTRIIAALLRSSGYYLGHDLNEAFDNLTYTLLFKRLISDSDDQLSLLFELFLSSLHGNGRPACLHHDLISSLAAVDRMGHTREWYMQRASALFELRNCHSIDRVGWKEPNTHILIDRILEKNDLIKYIHVVRDPYYMAYSKNQNQLANWAPLFFGRYVDICPRNSLSFSVKTHQRMSLLQKMWPDRMLMIRYEDAFARPRALIRDIESFIGCGKLAMDDFSAIIGGFSPSLRSAEVDYSVFDSADNDYIRDYIC